MRSSRIPALVYTGGTWLKNNGYSTLRGLETTFPLYQSDGSQSDELFQPRPLSQSSWHTHEISKKIWDKFG